MRKLTLGLCLLICASSAFADFPIDYGFNNSFPYNSTVGGTSSIGGGWLCVNRIRNGKYPEQHFMVDFTSGTPDPPGALKMTFPAGWFNAGESAHCWNVFENQQEEIYVQYLFKYSSNWAWHNIDNKQTYYWQGSGNEGNFYLSVNGRRKINMITQTYATERHTPNTSYNPTIDANRWYKITALFRMNTPGLLDGICQVWIDDRMVLNHADIGYRSSSQVGIGFREMTFTPVWGGSTGISKPAEDYVWFDKVIVQATPIGVGRTGQTPKIHTIVPKE